MMRRQHAFTLVELMVAVAVVAVVLTIALPSFFDYLLVQRLKGINAQIVTDLNYARGEAPTRGTIVRVVFGSDTTSTCYTVFTNPPTADVAQRCNCTLGPGSACSGTSSAEIRTVQVPLSSGISVQAPGNIVVGTGPPALGFNNVTGGLLGLPTDKGALAIDWFQIEASISPTRLLRTKLGKTGRPTVCSVGNNLGAVAC